MAIAHTRLDASNYTKADLIAAVRSLTVKPFAHEFFTIGKWTVAAHACGYFLSDQQGFRFSFVERDAERMVDVLGEILANKTAHATYITGSGYLRLNGEITPVKVGNVRSANEYFAKAIKKLGLDVLCVGELTLDQYRFAAFYRAG